MSRNFQCVSATQGECAALRTAVESMFSAPFLPAQAIFKGHSSSSPSHQEAQQQQQSPSARAARQASVGHTATDSASVWNLVHRFGEAVDWQQWDRYGVKRRSASDGSATLPEYTQIANRVFLLMLRCSFLCFSILRHLCSAAPKMRFPSRARLAWSVGYCPICGGLRRSPAA